jgi:hypothetical protein
VTFRGGHYKPASTNQPSVYTGYIDNAGSVPTLHVTSVYTAGGGTPWGASFTGSLGNGIDASIASGTNQLVVTQPTTGSPVIGLGSTVNIAGGTPSTATVTGVGSGLGLNGTYTLSSTVTGATTNEFMLVTGALPSPPDNLIVSGVTGTIATGQFVTDGGVNITGSPLLVTQSAGTGSWVVVGNYNPAFLNDATMVSSLSALVPGTYVQTQVAI